MTHATGGTGLRVAFAIPGDLNLPTGGYAYDRQVLARLAQHGVSARVLALPGSYPYPDASDLHATRRALEGVEAGEALLIDGLAWGAFPAHMADDFSAPLIALCHHPLGLEAGLSESQSRAFIASERASLARARHVIVTSRATRQTLTDDFGVATAKISVAEPGVKPALQAAGSGEVRVSLLAVGSIVPRKGYDVLVAALEGLADLDWRLRIVGALDRALYCVSALQTQIAQAGLDDRIELVGAASDAILARLYHGADLLVSASHYEGYGMALAEAMTRGLPIVTTTGGAAADTVPDEAGLKVPPGDVNALRQALRRAISDANLRAALSLGAARAAQSLPTWDDAARIVANVLRDVMQGERT